MAPATPPPADLAVVGGGPAGRALALRAAAAGLDVVVVDPAPAGPWPATYGAWLDELPPWLPPEILAATDPAPLAIARTAHQLRRGYAVLSTPRLQRWLTASPAVRVVEGRAVGWRRVPAAVEVVLAGGAGGVAARAVVDASGPRRVLTGGRPPGPRAAQTAVGVVLRRPAAEPALVMDWRPDHGEPDGWPSFLYAVPLGGGRFLLEETSLARRPGLPLPVLRRRLLARLRARGIDADPGGRDAGEHVAFVVDTPLTRGTGPVVPFGAAAPLVHPATGYSLAAALRLCDPLVAALAAGLPDGDAAAAAARRVLWPPAARAVHHLRRRGLEVLLQLPPDEVVGFFERFFALPAAHQRAYLSERSDLRAVSAAMWALYRAADRPLRRHLLRHGAAPVGDHIAPPVAGPTA